MNQSTERGASPISVIIILAIVFMITELVIMGGRVAAAHAHVATAARESARVGSLAASVASYETLAQDVAGANLANQSTTCIGQPEVSVDGSNFDRGGNVTTTVFCTIDLSDLSLLKLPFLPELEISASHTEIIETYRVVG